MIGGTHTVFVGNPGADCLDLSRVAKTIFSMMSAPCAPSARAMASPIPLVEPVTTAVLPFSMIQYPSIRLRKIQPTGNP
jgi:hypothetical protein